ncbi:other 1 protein kinase [Favolaschia claudopus]|uniref:Other 1 protein kinase n=1 Tax=Favolaschia claudopus TaxID=2862362 RepID=A0AAW0BPT5_9AGAR
MSVLKFSETSSHSSRSESTTADMSLNAYTNLDAEPPWPFDSTVTTLALSDGRSLELADSVFQSNCADGQIVYTRRAKMGSCGAAVKWSWGPTRIYEAQILESATNLAREQMIVNHHTEPRTLHILVQEELYPITELTTADGLVDAFLGIFKSYRWLYEAAGIMHRDIRLTTLTYRKLSSGETHGVLDGFNLAVLVHEHSLHHRLETPPPLLAFDLLSAAPPTEYLYRHDLETLFYALLLISCHYEDGAQIAPDRQPFTDWHELNPVLRADKVNFFFEGVNEWAPTAQFQNLRRPILYLRRMFRDGIIARDDCCDLEETISTFDLTTLGGHITFDSFENSLNTYLRPAS